MKITFISFLYFTGFLFSTSAVGQLSLRNPLICHDKNNYLKCYNDGSYILSFNNGNFKEFRTFDNLIKYEDADKKITFINENITYNSTSDTIYSSSTFDTIQIIQLSKSIIIKKGDSSLEITSLKEIPRNIHEYGISTYSIDKEVRGFTFFSGDKYTKLEVWTYGKTWSWNIVIKDNNRHFAISCNSYKNNRVRYIFGQDDSLRYGMSIAMTFKTQKKISTLESNYIDTVKIMENGTPVFGYIPLDRYYKYEYDNTGKLKTKKTVGELKLCDCE